LFFGAWNFHDFHKRVTYLFQAINCLNNMVLGCMHKIGNHFIFTLHMVASLGSSSRCCKLLKSDRRLVSICHFVRL